jgi:hypothetical protein
LSKKINRYKAKNYLLPSPDINIQKYKQNVCKGREQHLFNKSLRKVGEKIDKGKIKFNLKEIYLYNLPNTND